MFLANIGQEIIFFHTTDLLTNHHNLRSVCIYINQKILSVCQFVSYCRSIKLHMANPKNHTTGDPLLKTLKLQTFRYINKLVCKSISWTLHHFRSSITAQGKDNAIVVSPPKLPKTHDFWQNPHHHSETSSKHILMLIHHSETTTDVILHSTSISYSYSNKKLHRN